MDLFKRLQDLATAVRFQFGQVKSRLSALEAAGASGGVSPADLTAGLATKENTIAAGTTAQYWRGDKSWQTLNSAAVGLGNVNNTSDAGKPVSTAQQAALDLKANLGGAAFTGAITAPNLSGANTGDQDLSGKQPLDGTLTAFAALAWGAGTQVPALTANDTFSLKTVGSGAGNLLDKAAGDALYQPLDGDLTSIAGLAGTTGFAKKTAANTWALDTSTYLTANQLITLSGDVTGSGTTAIAVTIGANKVTRGMLATAAGATILGATAAGNVSDLTPAQAKTFLAIAAADVSGLGFFATGTDAANLTGTVAAGRLPAFSGGDVTSGAGSAVLTIGAGAVSLSKMANVATATVFYRKTAGAGAPEVQTLATLKTDLGLTGINSGDQTITLTGDVTGTGTGSFVTAIGANKVTRGMLAVTSGAALLGATGAGNVADLTAAQAKTFLSIAAADVSGLAAVATSGSASDLGSGTLPPARMTDYQNGNMEFHLQVSGWFLFTQQIANITTVAGVADRLQVHPWTPSRDTTIQKIGVEVTTLLAASNAKVVVYDTDPATGGPNNLLHETGNLSCAAVALVTEAYAFTFLKGVTYWLGVRTSSTQTLRAYLSTAVRAIGSATGTSNPATALQKTLTFATGAGAWGALSSAQLVTPNILGVVLQLA